MKKQLFILATITTIVFTSCSKEKIEAPQTNQPEEIAGARGGGGIIASVDLKKGLLGLFEFNGNLIDKTGKLEDGVTNTSGPASYTIDRKGFRGKAIKFNGIYNVSLTGVPHSARMSVAAWVKYDSANAMPSVIVSSQSDGPQFVQDYNYFYGYSNPSGNPKIYSGALNDQWHFLVATIDGATLRFYVDGSLVGSVASSDVDDSLITFYQLGGGYTAVTNWFGAMDDVRFYDRAISAAEVQALFNL